MKLLEEEEKEKREEEERKERKRTKDREKKLRRKERLKGKEKDPERKYSESIDVPGSPELSKEELSPAADVEQNNSIIGSNSLIVTGDDYPKIQDEDFTREGSNLRVQDCSYDDCEGDIENVQHHSYDDCDGDIATAQDRNDTSTVEQSKFYCQRLRYRKEFRLDPTTKWSDRRSNTVVSENGVVVGRSEPVHCEDNFGMHFRGVNGLNRQSRISAAKSNGRNIGHKCSERFYSSNSWVNDRYDFHSCSCNNRMNRVSWETKLVSKSESTVDSSKQFYRGSKYNHVDFMSESNGRTKSRVISGNYSSRDLPHSKKVWEPMESHKKYARSNSDSNVTLGSTGQVFQFDMVRSSIDEIGGTGEVDYVDCSLKRSGVDEGYQNDLDAEAGGSCSSTEITSEEPGTSLMGGSSLNNSSDPNQGSTSSSDNCSSCLSEGDNNTTSSNRENTESSTSDSEDASQQYEVRESSTCIDNGLSGSHEAGMEKIHNANDEGLTSMSAFGPSLDAARGDVLGNPVVRMAHNFDNCFSPLNVCSQSQSMLPPVPNQNIQFPVFQTPSAVGYYHHNPVSWPAAPTNGLVPIPHPNPYLYSGPFGYGLNEDPRFCLQYGGLQQPTPLFNPVSVPVYQAVARAKGLNNEEAAIRMSKPTSMMQEHLNLSAVGRVSQKAAMNGNSGNSQDTGFSLFHFGGPADLSSSHKLANASSNDGDNVGDFNTKSCVDQVHNENETTVMEEYNLFAASKSLRFSIF